MSLSFFPAGQSGGYAINTPSFEAGLGGGGGGGRGCRQRPPSIL